MTEQEYYSELYKHISKDMVTNMFIAQIREILLEPLASYYCNKLDNAKTLTRELEHYAIHY